MTKADPNPASRKRGKHHRSDVDDDDPPAVPEAPPAEPASPAAKPPRAEPTDTAEPTTTAGPTDGAEPPKTEAPTKTAAPPEAATKPPTGPKPPTEDEPVAERRPHAIGRHPAAVSLLTAAGLVTGISLAPLLLDRLGFAVALDAGANARSAAAPWPAGAEPWFWPSWVAGLAFLVAAVVLLLGLVGLAVHDLVVLALAGVLTLTTARVAWATFDVVGAGLWELVPLCILCVLAFGLSATAAARWRSAPGSDGTGGEGPGGVAAAALAAWFVVLVVLLAGAAIAASARTHAFGDVDSPPQGLPGLLSVRAADAPRIGDAVGRWVPQLAVGQVTDDAAASAYAIRHSDRSAQFDTLLVRGDDTGAPDLDQTWWVTIARQTFESRVEVENWCAENGLAAPDCAPRLITD